MVPKIIHYAWFGSPLPIVIRKRVQDWKKVLPGWKFVLWNESNYDLKKFNFTKKMYEQGKLGYVADELRYDVLNQYGGFYLDTDIIIKKDLKCFLSKRMVWGFQYDNSILTSMIGSEPNQKILTNILDVYEGKRIPELQEQSFHMTSNPFVTKILKYEFPNFKCNGKKQELESGIVVYPRDYFTYLSKNPDANFAEHLFDNSWGIGNNGLRGKVKKQFKQHFPYMWAHISAKRGVKNAIKDGIKLEK